ncbi:SNARE-interacting protein KEULE-like [Hibiscus syriacus]|uniref:SNARE-interacting protein KEULE-like n=1 Tax=Hibiscus syriacus TaxID=106335 RepID=UPI001924B007|nr:SNARE-interacting protein KEULE-like [Hibiscus syriacus]
MSYSDSDSSSGAGDYKNFKQISRERLLYEMLRFANVKDSKSTWKVLIMDKVTVKIMSYCCKMAHITSEVVSLVEDIHRRTQPLPSMDAIYFIKPTKENIVMFFSDMPGRTPLYKKAFVYFSSPIPRELIAHITKDSSLAASIGALSEMEYFAIDSLKASRLHFEMQILVKNESYKALFMLYLGKDMSFITDNGKALEHLFGRKGDACLNVMATHIATVFASLREFPFVRYRAAKSLDPMTMTTFRDLIPTKLAAGIWNCLVKCKSIPNFPWKETCELLILDRSIDQLFIFNIGCRKHATRSLLKNLAKENYQRMIDYSCMNDPSPSFHGISQAAPIHEAPVAHPIRSRRTPTWARPRSSDDGDSILRHSSSDFKFSKRIFVFIVGRATRFELRACHKLRGKLNREVILGSTSLDYPLQFITKMKQLTAHELSLDDLQI